MLPRIIADSDDSGDDVDGNSGYSPPLSRNLAPTPNPGLDSTDTASFQQLYDDQHAAAQRVSRGHLYTETDEQDYSYQSESRNGGIDDPYEIPSSPVNAPASVSSTKMTGPSATKEKAKKGRSRAEGDSTGLASSTQSRKRRKVERASLPPDEEDLDLVAFPSSHRDELEADLPEPLGSLPPTMPITHSQSLVVTMKTGPRAASYIRQHHVPQSTAGLSQDQGLSKPTQGRLAYASSGSMTNVNTPRTEKYASQDLEMAPIPENSPSPLRSRASKHIASSFDEITGLDDSIRSPSKETKQKSRVGGEEPQSADMTHDELDANYDEGQMPALNHNEDEDEEFMEKPRKSKKQRGRPKKDAATGVTKDASHVTTTDGGSTTAAPPKKKRGRPKKSQIPTEAEECPPVLHKSEPNQALTDALNEKPYKGQDQTQEESSVTLHTKDTRSESNVPEVTEQEAGSTALRACDEVGAASNESEASRKLPEEVASTPQVANHVDGMSSSVKLEKKVNEKNKKGLGALLAKPIYRVGLSKRSKIAPLLKSVPK